MRDPYDDDLSPDESSSGQRRLGPILIASLAGGLIACALLVSLLRWPVTGKLFRPILIGETETATAVATPVRTPTLTSRQTSSALLAQSPSSGLTSTPSQRATIRPPSPSPPSVAPASSSSTSQSGLSGDLLAELRRVMLVAINEDRAAQGLSTVEWDDLAAKVGQAHAEDMLASGYFSHWNLAGYGPEHRYALAGGSDAIAENIYSYWYRFDDGRAAPIADWKAVIRKAQSDLMNSPGHRSNILDPFRTHVGVGIAYDAQKGELRLTQEFVNRWVQLEPIPQHLAIGSLVTVTGVLLPGATDPLINLAYQPFPTLLSASSVPSGTYSSKAEFYQALKPDVADGRFTSQIRLGKDGQKGLYNVRVWVDVAGQRVFVADSIVWVDRN